MTLQDALRFATDTHDNLEYISRVKRAVIDYLLALDATTKISDTSYFNHSAIPDLVAQWPNERGERHVFLRSSYEAILAGQDARLLSSGDPILLALENTEAEVERFESDDDGADDIEGAPSVKGPKYALDELPPIEDGEKLEILEPESVLYMDEWQAIEQSRRTLVTDAQAIDVLNVAGDEDAASPLAALVRANFIRGGRGLVNAPVAKNLIDVSSAGPGGTSALITRSFYEDAATRINRTAQLISFASSEEFPPVDPATGEPLRLEGGQLSAAELGNVLPWLLRHRAGAATPEFWSYLASLTSLAALEGIRSTLRGLDLTPLVQAGARRWVAKRAAVGLAVEPIDDRAPTGNFWSFEAGPLGINVGEQRLSVAVNGQLIKDRAGSRTPAWDQIRPGLDAARLSRVALRGIARSVTVGAEQSDDISADVDSLTTSLDDRYAVDEVGLRFPKVEGKEGASEVVVHFDRGVVLGERDASLADVSRTALALLEFRDSAGAQQAQQLLD